MRREAPSKELRRRGACLTKWPLAFEGKHFLPQFRLEISRGCPHRVLKVLSIEMPVVIEAIFAASKKHVSPEGLSKASLEVDSTTGTCNVSHHELCPSDLRKDTEVNVVVVKHRVHANRFVSGAPKSRRYPVFVGQIHAFMEPHRDEHSAKLGGAR